MHWSEAAASGEVPQGIRSHSCAMFQNSKLFVFGGATVPPKRPLDNQVDEDIHRNNHLLIFDTETMWWRRPRVFGAIPDLRRAHSATSVDSKMIMFGGGEGPDYFDHLYVLDTETMYWTKPESTGTIPGPRRAHSATLIGTKIFIFGGGDGNSALNSTYILDTEKYNWDTVKIPSSGIAPQPRGYHTATLGRDNKIYVYGGSDGEECYGNIFCLDPATGTWSERKVASERHCFTHSATRIDSHIVSFGGSSNAADYTDQLQFLNLDVRRPTFEWVVQPTTGTAPSPRGYHSSVCTDSRLFIIGGYDGQTVYSDTHVLDLGIYSPIYVG